MDTAMGLVKYAFEELDPSMVKPGGCAAPEQWAWLRANPAGMPGAINILELRRAMNNTLRGIEHLQVAVH
jgi:hypothetical protein